MNIKNIKKQIHEKAHHLNIPLQSVSTLTSHINSIDEANRVFHHINNNSAEFVTKIDNLISVLKTKRETEHAQSEKVLNRIRSAFLN